MTIDLSPAVVQEKLKIVLDRFLLPPYSRELDAIGREYPVQHNFIMRDEPHLTFVGGVGSGKTTGGAIRALRAAYGCVGNKSIQTPNLGLVAAPTFDMIRDVSFRTFADVAAPYLVKHNKNEMRTTLRNGSEILWRSVTNVERRRGVNLSWLWMDEAAQFDAEVFQILIARLRQYGVLGHEWITTTPRGKNWLYKTFILQQGANPDYAIMRARSRDNPYVSEQYHQMLEANYSGDWARQELEAEFIDYEGLIYYMFNQPTHVTQSLSPSYREVYAGVDWGFRNPGVILVIGFNYDEMATVIHEEVRTGTSIEQWCEIAKELTDRYQIKRFYCDSSEPEFIRAFNRMPGISAVGATDRVNPGIQNIVRRLSNRTLTVHASCEETIKEFELYEWEQGVRGDRQDVPRSINNHTMDALRYPMYARDKQRLKKEARVFSYA